jgi:NAD-dependent DNA ligase
MANQSTLCDANGQPIRLFQRANNAAKAVDQLVGICTGILADGEVNENEAVFFAEWVRKHAPAEPVWPFTDVLQRIERIFADGVCDAEERAELKDVMEALCGFTEEPLPMADNLSTTLPLCVPQPQPLVFVNQQFVVTGKFAYGARTAVFEAISALGGLPTDTAPTKTTNYVVIGVFASRDWVNTSHGRKIEKAVQLRDKGTGLNIISEEHWKQFVH